MEIDDYVEKAMETCLPSAFNMPYAMSLIASEAGELNGWWSKAIRDNAGAVEGKHAEMMDKEAADILWGLALYAKLREKTLSELAQGNLDKLASRKERGVIGGSGDDR